MEMVSVPVPTGGRHISEATRILSSPGANNVYVIITLFLFLNQLHVVVTSEIHGGDWL
jgi:phosphoribosylpyrophosphate synthetase